MSSHSVVAARTLYFHTGTHKTGSTALQVYLAANKTLLGEAGVSYEFPDGADQSMGNGQMFFDQINERNISKKQLDRFLELYLAGRTVAICSSEDFTRFKSREWLKIKDACQRLKVEAKFVTFIRNIGPYYLSRHRQLIKGGENYSSFDEFCKIDQYSHILDSLRCLRDLFGRESMSAIHYESAMNNMDGELMGAIGIPHDYFDSSALKYSVNRSLTEYEQEILSRINAASGRQYSYELSDLLMKKRPHLVPGKKISQNIVEELMARHSVDVDWLNKTFFDGIETIKVSNNAFGNEYGIELSAGDRQAIDHDVANWCISKLNSAQDDIIKFIIDRLLAVDWKNAGNQAIPDDFDPLAYLLLNSDVMKACMPPYEHFIVSGQHEDGRAWKWTSQ